MLWGENRGKGKKKTAVARSRTQDTSAGL